MLIVFGGLPGTGKSTIAQALARELRAVYLRIDVIEHALRAAQPSLGDLGPTGYCIAYDLAASNLALGLTVIADSVNPLPITRSAWRAVALRADAPLLEVELVASDRTEHRRRIEARIADIPGATLPTWTDVRTRDYAPWPEPHLVLDTTQVTVASAVATIRAVIPRT